MSIILFIYLWFMYIILSFLKNAQRKEFKIMSTVDHFPSIVIVRGFELKIMV